MLPVPTRCGLLTDGKCAKHGKQQRGRDDGHPYCMANPGWHEQLLKLRSDDAGVDSMAQRYLMQLLHCTTRHTKAAVTLLCHVQLILRVYSFSVLEHSNISIF